MTMRLTVKNEDETRTARVRVRDFVSGPDGKHTGACVEHTPPRELGPGESADFWVHSGRDLVVEEVQTE